MWTGFSHLNPFKRNRSHSNETTDSTLHAEQVEIPPSPLPTKKQPDDKIQIFRNFQNVTSSPLNNSSKRQKLEMNDAEMYLATSVHSEYNELPASDPESAMSEKLENHSTMNFQNTESDSFSSEQETDEIEGDNISEDFSSLQDTILSGLSPQTCELLRSGLPPLGDVFGDRAYDFMLPTVQEVNSSEENRSSTPESVVLNTTPLEFYDERNFVRDMAREDTDQTVSSAEYKIINIDHQSEEKIEKETINTQDQDVTTLSKDTCKEEKTEENHAQNWVNCLNIENTENQQITENDSQNKQNSENNTQFIPSFTTPSPPQFDHQPTFGNNFSVPLSPKERSVAQRVANIERKNGFRSFPEISITQINVTAITGETLNASEELVFIDKSESESTPQLPRADPTFDEDPHDPHASEQQASEQDFELTTLTEIETTRTVSLEPKTNNHNSQADKHTSSVNFPTGDLASNAELSNYQNVDKIMEMENWELTASRTSLDMSDAEGTVNLNSELVSEVQVGLAEKSVSERYLNVDNVLNLDQDEVQVLVAESEIKNIDKFTDQHNLEENTKLTKSLEDTIRPTDSSPETPVSRFFEHLLKKHEANSSSESQNGTDSDSVKCESSTIDRVITISEQQHIIDVTEEISKKTVNSNMIPAHLAERVLQNPAVSKSVESLPASKVESYAFVERN
jgi:hypothetical protein